MIKIKQIGIDSFKLLSNTELNLEGRAGIVSLQGINLDNPNFSGNSVGKSTLVNVILQGLFMKNIQGDSIERLSNAYTKEKPSITITLEKEGVEYYYVDNEKALELEAADKVIEMRIYNTVYGEWKYFTVDDGQIRLGSGDKYIVIGTIEAYNKFCAYFGKDAILPIYIEVDDGIRLMRAINREQKQEVPQYEEMCRRFLADSKDFSEEKIKEAGINQRFSNDGTIEDCIRDIKEAIKQQLL